MKFLSLKFKKKLRKIQDNECVFNFLSNHTLKPFAKFRLEILSA